MSQLTRHRFAYAPLRHVDRFEVSEPEVSYSTDWYSGLSDRSSTAFDIVSVLVFAAVGGMMTWMSRHAMPTSWILAGQYDPMMLSLTRIGVICFSALGLCLLARAGARFGLIELPQERFWLLAVKFTAVMILGAGALFVYRDPSVGLVPMIGLMLIAMVLLFRMEPIDALKATVAMAFVSLPALYSMSAI